MTSLRLLYPVAAFLAVATVTAHAQRAATGEASASLFIESSRVGSSEGAHAADARFFTVDPANARRVLAQGSATFALADFPVAADGIGTLDLHRVRPFIDSRTEIRIGTAAGEQRIPVPEVIAYRGSIRGEEGSSVYMTLTDGMIFASVKRGDGTTWVVSPSTRGTDPREHAIAGERSLAELNAALGQVECVEAIPDGKESSSLASLPSVQTTNELKEVTIAVEADNSFYTRTGSDPAKAAAYIASLFGLVSVIFEDEVNTTLRASMVKVWTDAASDPYKVNGDPYALWDKVPNYWKANYDNVQRDLAHVLTSSPSGGGGKAYRGRTFEGGVSSICSRDYGYGMSSPMGTATFPTFDFTYDVYIVAHEIGHGFGARHTHDCWWSPAIDTCWTKDYPGLSLSDACHSSPVTPKMSSGSIMSYCANANYTLSGNDFDKFRLDMTFLPKVSAVMRQEVEAVECDLAPAQPTVILKSPRGSRRYESPADLEIVWTSSQVTTVSLEYSTNDGGSWNGISADRQAADGAYLWTLPAISSTSVLVRIFDPANPTVADTSLTRFEIVSSVTGEREMPAGVGMTIRTSPAAESATLLLAIPAGERGTLRAFDLRGNEVRLFDVATVAAGEQEIGFGTAALAPGTYFVNLETAGGSVTRSFAVVR